MDFRIAKGEFLEALYLTQGVVEKRNTLPIIANVLIEAEEGGVRVTATDLEVGIRRVCEASVKNRDAITVNARKLYEIVRELAAEEICLRSGEGSWVEVTGGKSRYRMLSLDPKDFPNIPAAPPVGKKGDVSMTIGGPEFGELVEKTLFAVSLDDTRLSLGGVYMESPESGQIRMVATDGHRLSLIERSVGGANITPGVILPRKGLVEVKRLLEHGQADLKVVVTGNLARVEREGVELFMRLIEGEFPDYRQVIPKDTTKIVRVDRDAMLGALRRVSIFSSERYRGARLQLQRGVLKVATTNPEVGEAVEDVEADYEGDEFTIGFNARYLLDVLSLAGVTGTIEINLSDDVRPGIIRLGDDEGYTYVVMPMRL